MDISPVLLLVEMGRLVMIVIVMLELLLAWWCMPHWRVVVPSELSARGEVLTGKERVHRSLLLI